MKEEYYYGACNNIKSIPKQIVVDHQVLTIFNVAHLLKKIGDPSPMRSPRLIRIFITF